MPAQNIDVVLRLLNGRRFNMAMNQSAAAVRAAKSEMIAAGEAGSGLAAAGNMASASMYALGGASRLVTYAIGAATAAWIALGIHFNATMESNSLALEHFAGGAAQARQMTKDLFQIARATPFSFTDITTAARQFMAYGFSVKESVAHLKTMGDVLSYVGGNSQQVMPLFTKAVGQIRQMGRLRQQELNQLTNLGINPIRALRLGGLDLTQKQLRNVGRAGIDADTALNALFTGLHKIYGGGSRKYLETFNGQWQRLKDNISAAAGQSTTGIFGGLKNALKSINDYLEKRGGHLSKTLKGIFEGGFKAIGAAFLFVKERVTEFLSAIAPAAPLFNNVLLPTLKGVAVALIAGMVIGWKLLILALKILAPILGFIGKLLAPFKPLFFLIGQVLAFVFGDEIAAAGKALIKFGGVFRWLGGFLVVATTPIRLIGSAVKALGRIFSFVGRGPVGIFRSALGAVLDFILSLPRRFFSAGGKLAKALITGILVAFGTIGRLGGQVGGAIAKWLNDNTIFGDKVDIGPFHGHIPKLASGGYITGGGLALVGEQGPEVVHLPSGASVIPNHAMVRSPNRDAAQGRGERFEGAGQPPIVKVFIGRRQIAEAVGEEVAKRRARG